MRRIKALSNALVVVAAAVILSVSDSNTRIAHAITLHNRQQSRLHLPIASIGGGDDAAQTVAISDVEDDHHHQHVAKPLSPLVPLPLRDYFSLDPGVERLLRDLAGPGMLPPQPFRTERPPIETTTVVGWTKATTSRDSLVAFAERTLERFLTGGTNGDRSPLATTNRLAEATTLNDYLVEDALISG